jgi:hypothetical protein
MDLKHEKYEDLNLNELDYHEVQTGDEILSSIAAKAFANIKLTVE